VGSGTTVPYLSQGIGLSICVRLICQGITGSRKQVRCKTVCMCLSQAVLPFMSSLIIDFNIRHPRFVYRLYFQESDCHPFAKTIPFILSTFLSFNL
jgi:hypothetical protein